jgi:hypothetical protein
VLNRSSIVSSALLAVVWMAPAAAQLSGVFAGNVNQVCVSSAGFDANFAALGPSFISSNVNVGTVTFNADGTGTLLSRSLNIGHAATNPGSTPAAENENVCPFTYTYSGGMISATFGTCSGMTLTGPNAGQANEQDGLGAQWMLLDRGTTLVGASTRPRVETFRNLATGFTNQRICHRTGKRFLRAPTGSPS